MMPALVEGTESIAFFGIMLMWPERLVVVSTMMTVAVVVNVVQRMYQFYQEIDEVKVE